MRSPGPLVAVFTAAAVFVADYASKLAVVHQMVLGQSIPVIPGVLDLTYIRNAGAAFGILQGRTLFLVVVTVAVFVGMIFYWRAIAELGSAAVVAVGLVGGGALGNLLDRLRFGTVVDFVHVHYFMWVFNVADSSVVVGGILLAWAMFRSDQRRQPPVGRTSETGREAALPLDAAHAEEHTDDQ